MSVELIRLFVVLAATAAGHALGQGGAGSRAGGGGGPILGALLGACFGYVAGGVLGRLLDRVLGRVEGRVEEVPAASLLAGAMGAIACGAITALVAVPAGLVVAAEARSAHRVAVDRWAWGAVAVVVWLGVAQGWRLGRGKGTELARRLTPLAGNGATDAPRATTDGSDTVPDTDGPAARWDGPAQASQGALVDTSAVMDGRLLVLARTGFLPRPLLVARFVLDEIQGLADTAEMVKRRRARRGLELLGVLRHEPGCDLQVLEDEIPELHEVDAKLVALARRLRVGLVTVDGPLEATAELQGVRCFNLARLADELRPTHIPGDVLTLALSRPGREPGQAVGFLDDGTMVVVGDAADRVGQEVAVRISSAVQSSVGRMLFATVSTASPSQEQDAPIGS